MKSVSPTDMIRVFIGYDPKEPVAFHVCVASIINNSSQPVQIIPLYLPHIANYTELHKDGSNEFIYSRFLVPYLCGYNGWAIYLDGDMVVEGDIAELWNNRNVYKSVHVVQHNYKTKAKVKYYGSKNEDYPKKNWSSVMLFNCSHFACRRLTPKSVEASAGAYLHQFKWCDPDRLGELDKEWNWLVGEYDQNENAKLYHYTLGVPSFTEFMDCDHADRWYKYLNLVTHLEDSHVHVKSDLLDK